HALVMDGKPVLQEGLYQPTFLYESLWDVGVAILVWQLDKRYRFGRGRAFALYAMAYTAGRFWIEALRVDPAHRLLGLRLNEWTAVVVFVAALIYFVRVRGPQVRLVTGEDGQLTAVPMGTDEPTGDAGTVAGGDGAGVVDGGDGAVQTPDADAIAGSDEAGEPAGDLAGEPAGDAVSAGDGERRADGETETARTTAEK
ncbi:MAG TPA: prolipoprotein diacylglyceryl transferase family protein, partial [Rugosimonospora sp.]